MEATAMVVPRRASTVREVWASPLYLGATMAMFLSGLGTSAAAPQIVLYLVKELGASLPVAGLYYLTTLVGPVAGYLVGSYSDRTGIRLNLFRLCALAGFVGWAGVALSTAIWMPFVISAIVLAFSGAAVSQIFAAVHDEQVASPSRSNEGVVAIIRMALTAGWIVGPVLGAWLGAVLGLRAMLWATAICFLVQILPLGTLGATAPANTTAGGTDTAPPGRPGLVELLPLLAFTGLFVLVYAGDSIKYGFLLIYMEDQLHIEPAVRGAVIGIQPFVELCIMPFSVILGHRIGIIWLMCIAAALGVIANLLFATSGSVFGMLAAQILMGGVWGVFMVLGILGAQRLVPSAVATASAIFLSSSALSSALGGVAGGIGVATLGLPSVFFIPAACSLLAVVGLTAMARKHNFH